MGIAIKHPVPDWAKPSFVIFHSGNSGCQRINIITCLLVLILSMVMFT